MIQQLFASEHSMQPYQTEFIDLARRCNVLKFGEFTLKSGRISPYFFNAGAFSSGGALAVLGRCYAQCIVHSGVEFDVLFVVFLRQIQILRRFDELANSHWRNARSSTIRTNKKKLNNVSNNPKTRGGTKQL